MSGDAASIPARAARRAHDGWPAARAWWWGVAAAVVAGRAVRRHTLDALLAAPAVDAGPRAPCPPDDQRAAAAGRAAAATAVAFGLLARLARLPGAPWRNTCLFRAVAECWLLRRERLPAVLRIGVARPGAGAGAAMSGTAVASTAVASTAVASTAVASTAVASTAVASTAVAAHAWVECDGVRCLTARGAERATYAVLRPAPAR